MVTFNKEELAEFNLDELKKMINIQIKSEKFEGAVLIRDLIEERKRDFGIGDNNNDEDDNELI